MNFPTSPTTGDTYTLGSKTWVWNGAAWDLQSAAPNNLTLDYVQLNTSATVTDAVGRIRWDADQGTADIGLGGGNIVQRLGQSLVAYVTNAEASTITKGQAVYLYQATGDRASVKLAYNTGDATSAKTLGIVAEDIASGASGFIMCQGVAYKMNTAAYTAGDSLYLGATAGSLTTTKPYAPNHLVYIGTVEKANAGNGQIYVRVQNGYELDELHNVSAQSPSNGQTIVYNSSTSLWEKNTVSLTAGVNGTLPVANGGTGVTTSTGSGNNVLSASPTLTGDVTINAQGDLRFADADSSNWVALQAPTTIASNVTWTLPNADGTSGQVLSTNGSGTLSWATGGSGSSQWTTSGSNIYYTTGGVSIGTTANSAKLDVGGFGSSGLNNIGIALTDSPSTANAGLQIAFRNPSTTYSYASIGYSNEAGASAGALLFYTNPSVFASTNTERMRIDSAGRVGIATTAQTSNIARLQVTHDPNTDRYGVYVPGGSYVGSGPSGTQYGGYFSNHTSNSASSVIGVAGKISERGAASTSYGVWGDGGSTSSNYAVGVYGTGRQGDLNGPGVGVGGWFNANTSGSSSGGTGSTYAIRAENTATMGSGSYGVYLTTVAGPTNIYGLYYEHAGSLAFRTKANGGIDNYSSNNTNLSDRREKTDFAPAKSYLDTICAIPVQTFKYNNQDDDLPTLGVVAQDVQAVAPELVTESNWGSTEEPKMRLSIYETDLMYALMKCIQEQQAIIESLKARLDAANL